MDIPREVIMMIISNYSYRCLLDWDGSMLTLVYVDDVNPALQLRAVCKTFARAYNIADVMTIIGRQLRYGNIKAPGCSFGRKEYGNVIRYNSMLWWDTLRNEAGRHVTAQALTRANGLQSRCTRMCSILKYTHESHVDSHKICSHAHIFYANPTLMFNNNAVRRLLETWEVSAEFSNKTSYSTSSQRWFNVRNRLMSRYQMPRVYRGVVHRNRDDVSYGYITSPSVVWGYPMSSSVGWEYPM